MLKESHIKSFIEKIAVLEESLGFFSGFDFYKPIEFDPADIVSIQNLGKSMAEFLGLSDLTFIIAIVPQEEKNVGGHIDFSDSSNDVFIEIDTEVSKHNDAVLATLAHELSHKILAINGIKISPTAPAAIQTRENEVLTDITAVYSGFGKQMINGCECSKTSRREIFNTVETTTESIKTGYISREQFSFIYLMICRMRKIEKKIYMSNINNDGKAGLEKCLLENSQYFKSTFHDSDYFQTLNELLQEKLIPTKNRLVEVENNLAHIQDHCLTVTEENLNNIHSEINEIQKQFAKISVTTMDNPSLNYLSHAKMFIDYKNIIKQTEPLYSKSELILTSFKKLNNYFNKLGKPFINSDKSNDRIIECKICKRKLKIPRNKGLIEVKCKNDDCKYVQLIDTNPLVLEEISKKSFGAFFKKLFSRK